MILLYHVIGYRKKVVRSNLKITFPDKNEREIKGIEKKFYRHFCDITLESFKILTISEKQIKVRFKFKNLALFQKFDNNKSVVMLLGHYSNWEWLFSMGYDLNSQIYGIYTPIMNKYFDELIKKIRGKHGTILISRYRSIEFIKKKNREGEIAIYGMVSDQSPNPKARSYWRDFLGVKVPVFMGGEFIARNMDYAVIYARINRVKRGYYEIEFELITNQGQKTNKYEITDAFYELLENDIRKNPVEYLWTHNRFKHRDKAQKD